MSTGVNDPVPPAGSAADGVPAGRARSAAARPRSRRLAASASRVLLPLLGLAIGVGAWWGATLSGDNTSFFLPPPPEVLSELVRVRDYLLEEARVTLVQTLVGFGITLVGGLLIGVAIAGSRIVDRMTTPWLVAFNAVPKVALAPVLILWLHLNMKPRIAMVILLCFFPIVLATIAGLKATPVELVELARSLDSSRWRTFAKVRFPYALPQIFVGLKVAMPLALIGSIVGELAGGAFGLGYVIQVAGGAGNSALAFAAITVVSVMGIVLFYAVVVVERLMLPWVRATTA